MFHFGNVYLENEKSDLVIQTLWIIHKFFAIYFSHHFRIISSWNKDAQWISSGA
jgi:hypothetical protein